jgi:hypothetical protein
MSKGMDNIWRAATVVALGYLVFYVYTLYKKDKQNESFQGCKTVLDTSNAFQKPYVTTETSMGDFEQDFIYNNEGGKDSTREAILMAKRKFPFDWSQLPPDSSLFQAQQAMFVSDPTTKAAPFNLDTFVDIESKKVLPPDNSIEQKEFDALATYKPNNLNTVDTKDVKRLIKKLYGDKGLVASVAKKANNVYEVYEVREKNPKIIYEDEINSSIQSNELNPKIDPSEMVIIPRAVDEVNSGLMQYGNGEKTNIGRREYNDYNPNLEGIFGPKMQWQQYG